MICTLEHFIYSAFVMYRIPYTAYHNSFLSFQKRSLRHKKFENYKNAVTIGKIHNKNFVPHLLIIQITKFSLAPHYPNSRNLRRGEREIIVRLQGET
jgi:hypothetical protein